MATAGGPPAAKVIQAAYQCSAYLGASIAGNGCLLVGVFHLTGNYRITRGLSRYRLAIDVFAAAVMPVAIKQLSGSQSVL